VKVGLFRGFLSGLERDLLGDEEKEGSMLGGGEGDWVKVGL
jgi:hypothetical protein